MGMFSDEDIPNSVLLDDQSRKVAGDFSAADTANAALEEIKGCYSVIDDNYDAGMTAENITALASMFHFRDGIRNKDGSIGSVSITPKQLLDLMSYVHLEMAKKRNSVTIELTAADEAKIITECKDEAEREKLDFIAQEVGKLLFSGAEDGSVN